MSQQTTPDISIPILPFTPQPPAARQVPQLETGDHLDQKTFHERYASMPEDFRAELIEGMVIVTSPVKRPHGRAHFTFNGWLGAYVIATPGVEGVDNTTAILSDESEPQPDTSLYLLPEYGGQCRFVDDYLTGAPEWVGEIASSSESYDLHGKYRVYERAGVLEYLVILMREQAVRWFKLREGRFEPLEADAQGVYRSLVFPGLWLDSTALFRNDGASLIATLQRGLRSPEHAVFVKELQDRAAKQQDQADA